MAYARDFRALNKIKQAESIRPKTYSIYNFSEQGAYPLPPLRYYKLKAREEAAFLLKKQKIKSHKLSFIFHNRFERYNTYLKGKGLRGVL